MKGDKIYRGTKSLPKGKASNNLIEGCIVLEGGAFRGLYNQGVLDAFMEQGINLSCTIGVSAGALAGMNYVAGRIGASARINLTYRHDKRYVGSAAIKRSHSLIGFDFMFNRLQRKYPLDKERFYDPNRRLIAVATNCETGETEYFEKGITEDIIKAVQASASMPYVSKMVEVDGKKCLDGGCSCKVPYRWALDHEFQKIIVVRTRERQYRKHVSSAKPARRIYRDYPEFADKLDNSTRDYNAQCEELIALENSGRIFTIAPSKPVEVKRIERDMDKLADLYYLGYSDAYDNMESLKEYLEISDDIRKI